MRLLTQYDVNCSGLSRFNYIVICYIVQQSEKPLFISLCCLWYFCFTAICSEVSESSKPIITYLVVVNVSPQCFHYNINGAGLPCYLGVVIYCVLKLIGKQNNSMNHFVSSFVYVCV